MFGDAFAASYEFCAQNASGDILQRLTKELLLIDATARVIANSDEYSVSAALTFPGDSFEMEGEMVTIPGPTVEVMVNVYQVNEDDEELVMVTVHRKDGAITTFQKCFMTLRDAFMTEVDLNLAEMKLSGEAGDQEEEDLSEDLGMI
jgi:hypothetical protein